VPECGNGILEVNETCEIGMVDDGYCCLNCNIYHIVTFHLLFDSIAIVQFQTVEYVPMKFVISIIALIHFIFDV
jgi:hypothetical protein